ncbi:aminodeoxychorismate synthase component I [Nitrincola schmidtii]|uniref:aminodeoxychorismate synthase component I n=1 Tax=Nitrincola schmidtii TaxID=1730894 RepID=UPI00124C020C|nr:aminodeoxychorismate synthase component I [Nitrincola schmidtii]
MISHYPLPYPLNASQVFAQLRPLGQAVILDSCYPQSQFGRYDIITAAPVKTARLTQQGLEYRELNGTWQSVQQEPFSLLQEWLETLSPIASKPPFNGGLIGYFSYDLGRHLERLPNQAIADINLPDFYVGLYLQAVVIDHHAKQSWLVVHETANQITVKQFQQRLETVADTGKETSFHLLNAFTSNVSETDYQQALDRIHHYIEAGDCYQINFAQRFTASYQGDPWQAWQLLKESAPTPFAAFIDLDNDAVLSLSPERFLFCDTDGQVETRPIKGTRPRGIDSSGDHANAKELLTSEKDRAENVMIVDLLRNDLSKVCQPGSVKVPELFKLESYPNVHHLVSSVAGKLEDNKHPLDLLRACFPGGSITGAPKIRAMEIIDELEPHRRSVYCGSIAYVSACGQMDSSITIRTLVCHQQQIHCWAGGGIVADSNTEAEYAETYSKVNNLLTRLEKTIKTTDI